MGGRVGGSVVAVCPVCATMLAPTAPHRAWLRLSALLPSSPQLLPHNESTHAPAHSITCQSSGTPKAKAHPKLGHTQSSGAPKAATQPAPAPTCIMS